MISTKHGRSKSVKDLLNDIQARSWPGWGAHFVVYLIYLFLQVALFDGLHGFFGIASRLLVLILTLLLLGHALILYIHDWRTAHKRRLYEGDKKSKRGILEQ